MSWTRTFVVALIILALGYIAVVAPQRTRLADASAREVQLRLRFERGQRNFVHLDALKRQMRELDARLERLQDLLPTQFDEAAERAAVQAVAAQSGVQLEDLRYQEALQREFYGEIPFTLQASGSFPDLYHFLLAVFEAAGPIRSIDVAELDGDPDSDVVELTLAGRSFLYFEEHSP